MPETLPAAFALVSAPIAGAGLGALYFGGLWWTVRHAGSFRRPVSSMLVSVLVRMTVALGGFYLVAGGSWQRLLLCLAGFVGARAVVSWRVRPAMRFASAPEVARAP